MAILHIHEPPVNPASVWLRKHAGNVRSQSGEDGIIAKILDVLPPVLHWVVEFGAGDGERLSNSWDLINTRDWCGVLVESNGVEYAQLADRYAKNLHVTTFNDFVAHEGDRSLDAILGKTDCPPDFGVLSIDVDGMDFHIWAGLGKYRPAVVVIEFNPTVPNAVTFVQDADPEIKHGCSLRALIELAAIKGYQLVATTQWNAFFVLAEHFPRFEIEDNSIDAMHQLGNLGAHWFQLYTGEVVVAGCRRLVWHNVEMELDDIQPLPVALRRYPGA